MTFFMLSTLHSVYFLPTKYYCGEININIDKMCSNMTTLSISHWPSLVWLDPYIKFLCRFLHNSTIPIPNFGEFQNANLQHFLQNSKWPPKCNTKKNLYWFITWVCVVCVFYIIWCREIYLLFFWDNLTYISHSVALSLIHIIHKQWDEYEGIVIMLVSTVLLLGHVRL